MRTNIAHLAVLHRQFRSQKKCGFYRKCLMYGFFYYVDFNCDVHTFITDGYLQLIKKFSINYCFKVDSMKFRVCPLFIQCALPRSIFRTITIIIIKRISFKSSPNFSFFFHFSIASTSSTH